MRNRILAERRMFTKKITESDAFLDMPMSTQCLYFHLNMAADDDGFVNNPKKIMRSVGASEDDFKLLIAKAFVIAFDTGVIVIKHWKMHNYIQSDRYKPTDYKDEKAMLSLKENKAYTLNGYDLDTECIQDVSIGKDRIGKDRIGKDKDIYSSETIHEIIDYLNKVCGTHYRYGDKTVGLIKTRMKEGFTVEDFKKVIDKKYADWSKGDMAKYLRPETLFGTKFESYLNEKGSGNNESVGSNEGVYDDYARQILADRGVFV